LRFADNKSFICGGLFLSPACCDITITNLPQTHNHRPLRSVLSCYTRKETTQKKSKDTEWGGYHAQIWRTAGNQQNAYFYASSLDYVPIHFYRSFENRHFLFALELGALLSSYLEGALYKFLNKWMKQSRQVLVAALIGRRTKCNDDGF